MAANKSSRPTRDPEDMLVGLDNILGKKNESTPVKSDVSPEPISTITPIKRVEDISSPKQTKRKPGRPRKFKEDDETFVIGVKLLVNEARFLEEYGGKYGGKTGYVTYLIREEMKRRGVQ